MLDGLIDRRGHVGHVRGAAFHGAFPPAAGENAVDCWLIETELDDSRGIAADDGEVGDIFGDDCTRGDDRSDADAMASGRDEGARAEPGIVADFEFAELHRIFFDEAEMTIEEERMR